MTTVLTRDAILAASDMPPIEAVHVPEWGGQVFVRPLTATERDQFERRVLQFKNGAKGSQNLRSVLVAMAACDADGQRLFTDEDAVKLGAKCAAAMDRVYEVASRLSGLTGADTQELEKNS